MQLNTGERDTKDNANEVRARVAQFAVIDPFEADNPLAQMLDKPDFKLEDALSLILDLELNPNTVNSKGDAFLHILARERFREFGVDDYSRGYYDITYYSPTNPPKIIQQLKRLKGKKADFNLKNKEQKSPLQIILDSTHPEAGLYLIELGADVNTKNSKGQTLLHLYTLALINRDKRNSEWQQCVAALIKNHGANINEPNGDGLTAFQLLLNNSFTIACMHLLQLGANVEDRNSSGKPILGVLLEGNTIEYRYDPYYGHMHQYGNDSLITQVIQRSVNHPGQPSAAEMALRTVLESDRANNPKFTHNARLLLELGAPITTSNSKGETFYSILEASKELDDNQKIIDQLLQKYPPELLGGVYGRKKRILAPLEAYAGKAFGLSALWHKNNDRAQALIKAIMNTNDLKAIGSLLRSQLDLFSQSNRAANAGSPSSLATEFVPAAASPSSSPIDARFNQHTSLPEQMKGYGDMSKESGFFNAVAQAYRILNQIMIEDNPALAETGEPSDKSYNL